MLNVPYSRRDGNSYYQNIMPFCWGLNESQEISYDSFDNDCNDNDPAINPAATEVCNYIDDDCNSLTDDGYISNAKCFRTPECTGTLDCAAYSGSNCPSGCTRDPLYGRCSDVGNFCIDNGDCTSGTCVGFAGYECVEGYDSCTRFTSDWDCDAFGSAGCGRACGDDSSMEACESDPDPTGGNCQFICENLDSIPAHEVCGDGLDNDFNGFIDCEDVACQVTGAISTAEATDLNCLGSPQTGNYTLDWYCGISLGDESVGLCCQDGDRPVYVDFLGTWQCGDSQPCSPLITATKCDYYYDSEFSSWDGSEGTSTDAKWCVAPAEGRACCSVVHFAQLEYWDDDASGNVKVY